MGVIKAIFYFNYTLYIKRSIRRVKEKYIKRKIIYNNYKEIKLVDRPLNAVNKAKIINKNIN
jgi:hypothetical protein